MAGTRFAKVSPMSARPLIAALRLGVPPLLATALSLATAACAPAPGSAAGNLAASADSGAAQRFTDREEIEQRLRYEGRADIRTIIKTNVDIHMSAVGRYEDELMKHRSEWLIAKRRRIE